MGRLKRLSEDYSSVRCSCLPQPEDPSVLPFHGRVPVFCSFLLLICWPWGKGILRLIHSSSPLPLHSSCPQATALFFQIISISQVGRLTKQGTHIPFPAQVFRSLWAPTRFWEHGGVSPESTSCSCSQVQLPASTAMCLLTLKRGDWLLVEVWFLEQLTKNKLIFIFQTQSSF